MKRIILCFSLVILACTSFSQVIKRGKGGRNVYVRVEDTTSQKPFEFKKQSMVTMSLYDLLFTNVTLNYEFFRPDGKMGYQLPISINTGGLPDTSDYRVQNTGRFLSQRNRIFQTGFSLNYYPDGQNKVNYYVGVNFLAGWFYYWHYTYATPPGGYYGPTYVSNEKLIGNNVSGAIHGGILFNPKETLTFSLRAGVGLRRYGTIYQEYTFSYMQFDACIGFKF